MLKDTDPRCSMCGQAMGAAPAAPPQAPSNAGYMPQPPMQGGGGYMPQPPMQGGGGYMPPAQPPPAANIPMPAPGGYPAPSPSAGYPPPPPGPIAGGYQGGPPPGVPGGQGFSPWAQQSVAAAPSVPQAQMGFSAQPQPGAPAMRAPSSPMMPPHMQPSPPMAVAGQPQQRMAPGVVAMPPMMTPQPPLANRGGMMPPAPIMAPHGMNAPGGGMPMMVPPSPAIMHGHGGMPPAMAPAPIGSTYNQVQPLQPIPDAQGAPVLVGFLVTFQNEPTGKFWPIRSGRAHLGRAGLDNEAEIALLDASTSARHAVLSSDPTTGTVYVEDAGSRNGTFVNEQKLQPGVQRQLHDNDRLRLGSITLVVKLLAS